MTTSIDHLDPAAYLEQAAWLRRLAGRLVHPDDADDLVQETYAAWSARPPRHQASPRGWMAQVARNLRAMQARARGRRAERESHAPQPAPWLEPDELVARAQRLRVLSEAVEALDPTLRETVLRHYFEGQSLAEIARREGCPSATVRGRLRTALARLRDALDEQHGGRREDWLAAFAPLVTLPPPGTAAPSATTGMLAKACVAAGTIAIAAGCATMAMRGGSSATPAAVTDAPVDVVRTAATPSPAVAVAAPTDHVVAPPEAPGNAEQLRAAVLAARIARLQAE
ncbi:MAG: RNA polymerase sigma factor, partial [Myxococcota bacterium]